MAIAANNIISASDINNGFVPAVRNVILDRTFDSNSPPTDGIYNCVPLEILGDINRIPAPDVGTPGTIISASGLYNNLIGLTTILTRVGTWSYVRMYSYQDAHWGGLIYDYNDEQYSTSGKAFFTSAYVRTLAAVSAPEIFVGKIISASSIHALFANILQAWINTDKYHHAYTQQTCHGYCYHNCYTDCHDQDRCYK